MGDKIAILGLVVALLSGVAVPVGLALLERGAETGAAPPLCGSTPLGSNDVPTTVPPTSGSEGEEDSPPSSTAPPPSFGKTLKLAEDSYADLDRGTVGDDELFRREADIALRSLDLTAARAWSYGSKVRMAVVADGGTGPLGCTGATRFIRSLSDLTMRVGTQV